MRRDTRYGHSARTPAGISSPELRAAARAKRARDHLARKRERDRLRLERERSKKARREGRERALLVLTPILCLTATCLGVVTAGPLIERLWLDHVPLERIAVQGAARLAPDAIAAAARPLPDRPLGALDPESIGHAVAEEPWVASARTLRFPNGTLVVRIVERRAIARWQRAVEAPTRLVEPGGSHFDGELATGGPLPLVRGEMRDGEVLPSEALTILEEMSRHEVLRGDPERLTLHLPGDPAHTGYVLELGTTGPRALLGRRLLPQRVARLAALLEEDEALARRARLIDLRYADRAVLQTEPAPG